jgi:hypothetical protein
MGVKGDAAKMTVVAELTVESPQGVQTVQSFERAWVLSQTLPVPVVTRFTGFVHR